MDFGEKREKNPEIYNSYYIYIAVKLRAVDVKSTVSKVFEDLTFKISDGYKQNWSFKCKVLKYQGNFRPHLTMIYKFGETANLNTLIT